MAVTAWIHADGHDALGAAVRYRPAPARGKNGEWLEQAMQPLGNDEWGAEFVIDQQCPYEYTVHANGRLRERNTLGCSGRSQEKQRRKRRA